MNRRTFLKGLGFTAGAAMFSPWVSRALGNGTHPCRYVFVVEGNALEPECMMSMGARTAIDLAATGSTTGRRWFPDFYGHDTPIVLPGDALGTAHALSPLLGGVDLTSRAAVVLGLSSRVTGGGHSTHCGALSSTRSPRARPGGITIDALLAGLPSVRGTAPYDAVRLGVDGVTVGENAVPRKLATVTCAAGPGKPIPVITDAELAYQSLFNFIPGYPGHSNFSRRTDQLNFASEDVSNALSQFGGNSRERAKLEQYLQSLDTIHQRQLDLAARAALIDPNDPATAFPAPEQPDTNPLFASNLHLDRLQAQFDSVTAALLGGLTNVAVLTSGTGGDGFDRMQYPSVTSNYSGIPTGIERHDLHHDSAGVQDYIDAIHDVSRAHVAMIADLARTLAATPEGNGTMLDNTVIVYLSDNGEQHHSSADEWPVLLLGGDNMGFRTDGRTVVYPGVENANNRQLSNLFNTLGHSAGMQLDDFGSEGATRIATGPLDELRT